MTKNPCQRKDCNRSAILTMRLETDEGPAFMSFCAGHLEVARDLLQALIDEEDPPPAAPAN